jgi:hypothetical protein
MVLMLCVVAESFTQKGIDKIHPILGQHCDREQWIEHL